jgi:hypothetical protein
MWKKERTRDNEVRWQRLGLPRRSSPSIYSSRRGQYRRRASTTCGQDVAVMRFRVSGANRDDLG